MVAATGGAGEGVLAAAWVADSGGIAAAELAAAGAAAAAAAAAAPPAFVLARLQRSCSRACAAFS